MKLNLLLVSIDKFPSEIAHKIQEHGVSCNYARGRLKTKEILDKDEVSGVLWYYRGYSEALAHDLIGTFNQHNSIPIIILVSEPEEQGDLKVLQNRLLIIDINDDIKETLIEIEGFCLLKPRQTKTTQTTGPELHEIDFKQVMKPIVRGDKNQLKQSQKSSFSLLTPWSAVDNREKNVISKPYQKPTGNPLQKFIARLKQFLF